MYQFINDYPYFRENGLSNECQGVCHDKDNWYFTQDGNLWKIPLVQDLNQKFSEKDFHKNVQMVKIGGHLGDIDYCKIDGVGYIFVPDMDGDYNTYISVWRASDLKMMVKYPIYHREGRFKSIGWCAINRGFLYTSESLVKGFEEPVFVYKIDFSVVNCFNNSYCALWLRDENGKDYEMKDMQGGCFDDEDHLHLANGYWKNDGRDKQGIHIFHIPNDLKQGEMRKVHRICKSNQKNGFKYKFDTSGQEPEGMTWWDLDKDNRAPAKERGQLHVILLDNDPGGTDDLVFKHFRRNK